MKKIFRYRTGWIHDATKHEDTIGRNDILAQLYCIRKIKVCTAGSAIIVDIYSSPYSSSVGGSFFTGKIRNMQLYIDIESGYTYYSSVALHGTKCGIEKWIRFYKNGGITNIPHVARYTCLSSISYIVKHKRDTSIYLPGDALEYISEKASRLIKQAHGADIPDFKSYGSLLTLNNVVLYVRCPNISPSIHSNLISIDGRYYQGYRVENTDISPEEIKTLPTELQTDYEVA